MKDTNAPGLFSVRNHLLHRRVVAAARHLLVAPAGGRRPGPAGSGDRREVSRWVTGENLKSVGVFELVRDG
jgi:hypothetical protein